MAQATLSIAFEALRFAANSADVFPPLKTGAAGALHIIQLIQVRVCLFLCRLWVLIL